MPHLKSGWLLDLAWPENKISCEATPSKLQDLCSFFFHCRTRCRPKVTCFQNINWRSPCSQNKVLFIRIGSSASIQGVLKHSERPLCLAVSSLNNWLRQVDNWIKHYLSIASVTTRSGLYQYCPKSVLIFLSIVLLISSSKHCCLFGFSNFVLPNMGVKIFSHPNDDTLLSQSGTLLEPTALKLTCYLKASSVI